MLLRYCGITGKLIFLSSQVELDSYVSLVNQGNMRRYALVVKLANTVGLGPAAEKLGGSSPLEGTRIALRGFFAFSSWVALQATHQEATKKPLSIVMVPRRGLEPPRPCGH